MNRPTKKSVPAPILLLTVAPSMGGRTTVRAWDPARREGFTMTYRSRRAAACGAFARITKGWTR